ncbi:unnamed protein product [Gordionus sp. m RMFG-2023]
MKSSQNVINYRLKKKSRKNKFYTDRSPNPLQAENFIFIYDNDTNLTKSFVKKVRKIKESELIHKPTFWQLSNNSDDIVLLAKTGLNMTLDWKYSSNNNSINCCPNKEEENKFRSNVHDWRQISLSGLIPSQGSKNKVKLTLKAKKLSHLRLHIEQTLAINSWIENTLGANIFKLSLGNKKLHFIMYVLIPYTSNDSIVTSITLNTIIENLRVHPEILINIMQNKKPRNNHNNRNDNILINAPNINLNTKFTIDLSQALKNTSLNCLNDQEIMDDVFINETGTVRSYLHSSSIEILQNKLVMRTLIEAKLYQGLSSLDNITDISEQDRFNSKAHRSAEIASFLYFIASDRNQILLFGKNV